MDAGDEDVDESEEGGFRAELLWSYVSFGLGAIAKRKLLAASVFVLVAGLALGLLAVWPRTYHAETRLMAQRNVVLAIRGDVGADALRGAADVIMRRDNLIAVARQTDLVRNFAAARPALFRLKDAVSQLLHGPLTETERLNALVGTLEVRLGVVATDATLTITIDWSDASMAARILEAAEQNFLESRHVAEISTIAEYISILEGHAVKLRGEVDAIAEQMQRMREERLAQVGRRLAGAAAPAEGAPPTGQSVRRSAPRRAALPDEELARMKVMLDAKQRAIAELEDFRSRRVLELQSKLTELKSRYTSAHPLVLDAEQNLQSLSRESPQVASLRAEVNDLQASMKARSAAAEGAGAFQAVGGDVASPPVAMVAAAGPLPSEVMRLMNDDTEGLDPAVNAQLHYAVEKYTALRSQISTARIDLDTAQAAFKHRYKIIVPPEAPTKAAKPRVAVMATVGILLALLLAFLTAVAAELRSGRIVETWQVEQLALPVLAELRFPPGRPDD
jgi:hypothetical protein